VAPRRRVRHRWGSVRVRRCRRQPAARLAPRAGRIRRPNGRRRSADAARAGHRRWGLRPARRRHQLAPLPAQSDRIWCCRRISHRPVRRRRRLPHHPRPGPAPRPADDGRSGHLAGHHRGQLDRRVRRVRRARRGRHPRLRHRRRVPWPPSLDPSLRRGSPPGCRPRGCAAPSPTSSSPSRRSSSSKPCSTRALPVEEEAQAWRQTGGRVDSQRPWCAERVHRPASPCRAVHTVSATSYASSARSRARMSLSGPDCSGHPGPPFAPDRLDDHAFADCSEWFRVTYGRRGMTVTSRERPVGLGRVDPTDLTDASRSAPRTGKSLIHQAFRDGLPDPTGGCGDDGRGPHGIRLRCRPSGRGRRRRRRSGR